MFPTLLDIIPTKVQENFLQIALVGYFWRLHPFCVGKISINVLEDFLLQYKFYHSFSFVIDMCKKGFGICRKFSVMLSTNKADQLIRQIPIAAIQLHNKTC